MTSNTIEETKAILTILDSHVVKLITQIGYGELRQMFDVVDLIKASIERRKHEVTVLEKDKHNHNAKTELYADIAKAINDLV